MKNSWDINKEVAGYIAILDSKEMFALGEVGKINIGRSIIAVFGEVGTKVEDQSIADLKRVIDCVNYFKGIENIKEWIEKNPRK